MGTLGSADVRDSADDTIFEEGPGAADDQISPEGVASLFGPEVAERFKVREDDRLWGVAVSNWVEHNLSHTE